MSTALIDYEATYVFHDKHMETVKLLARDIKHAVMSASELCPLNASLKSLTTTGEWE